MEEVLLRFGHLGKQIFNNLDIQSLKNCNEVSQSWKEFIHRENIPSFKSIKLYSNLPDASIRKFLRKFDSDHSELMAIHVKMVYKKIFMIPNLDRPYPFHFAAECGFLEICEMIMENMDEKNPKGDWGLTPLHLAAENGKLEVCKLILKNLQCDKKMCKRYKCDKNPKNVYDFTPLHMAAMNGHLEVCKLIIENICENPKPRSDWRAPKNPKSRSDWGDPKNPKSDRTGRHHNPRAKERIELYLSEKFPKSS